MQSDLFSRTAAAQYLGVKPQTLAVWFSTGRYPLPVVKVGRYAKYRLSDLQAFLQANTFSHSGSTQGGESA
nr:helix-turn-helix domain-containing protein [Herbaspirillum sp. ASV7]